jgi:hypothetical protein
MADKRVSNGRFFLILTEKDENTSKPPIDYDFGFRIYAGIGFSTTSC